MHTKSTDKQLLCQIYIQSSTFTFASCSKEVQVSLGVAWHAVFRLSLKLLYECSSPSHTLKQTAVGLSSAHYRADSSPHWARHHKSFWGGGVPPTASLDHRLHLMRGRQNHVHTSKEHSWTGIPLSKLQAHQQRWVTLHWMLKRISTWPSQWLLLSWVVHAYFLFSWLTTIKLFYIKNVIIIMFFVKSCVNIVKGLKKLVFS